MRLEDEFTEVMIKKIQCEKVIEDRPLIKVRFVYHFFCNLSISVYHSIKHTAASVLCLLAFFFRDGHLFHAGFVDSKR